MDEQGIPSGPVEPKGRVGFGRGGSTRTSIGMEPILDQQGNTSGVSPSERTFSAPYIVTVMRGVQLCSGSSRYFCRLSGLNQGSTPLRAIGPILNRPRSRWRMALSPAWCETSPSSLRRCASTPFIPVPLATSPQ